MTGHPTATAGPMDATPAIASRRPIAWKVLLPLLSALLAVGGCGPPLETEYGTLRGASVNGMSAFVRLLRDSGHATTLRRRVPARIDADLRTLVVVDDSFDELDHDALESLKRWLDGSGRHTLLLLLRDGDAAIGYLRAVLERDDVGAAEKEETRFLLARAEANLEKGVAQTRQASPPIPDGLEPAPRGESAGPVEVRFHDDAGDGPVEARFDRHRQPAGSPDAETLWEADGVPLLTRTRVGADEVLVLATALPLLNASLVDPGNRSLAERLAGSLSTEGDLLVVGSTDVSASEEDEEERSAWHLLSVQPLPWVALQAAVAMLTFCWFTAPILGRPRRVRPDHAQDFSHHVEALAALLARIPGAGAAFAMERLEQWRQAPRHPASRARRRRL